MIDGKKHRSCLVCETRMVETSRYPGLLQCAECGFITADIRLSPEEISSLYGPDYFHGAEYSNYIEEKSALQTNFAGRIVEILTLPGVTSRSRLFEIGCAYGFFMELAKASFAKVAGIDVAESAVDYARDTLHLDASCGDFLTSSVPFAPDVVTMWDVIEHLERPDLVVRKAFDILAPGGYICITTGDIGSLAARLRGPRWRMIHPPTHLHYFSRDTLGSLLTRSGFSHPATTYPSVKRTIGSMLYGIFKLRLNAPRAYAALSRLPGQDISIPLNFFDIMFVIARKPA